MKTRNPMAPIARNYRPQVVERKRLQDSECPNCGGMGELPIIDADVVCNKCNGTGIKR